MPDLKTIARVVLSAVVILTALVLLVFGAALRAPLAAIVAPLGLILLGGAVVSGLMVLSLSESEEH